MNLVVDVGNSRLKWAAVRGGQLEAGARVERREPLNALLNSAWRGLEAPAAVVVSSVAGADFDAQLEEWMAGNWGCRPSWFRSEAETLGIVNAYSKPSRLGSDRWAAIVGARVWSDGAVGVIDCGTAVTLDILGADDHHLGGWIFPGVELCRQSLLSRTANVRETLEEAGSSLGRSTAECVANGTLLGVAGTLDRWAAVVERELGVAVTWLATGGDWPRLHSLVARPVRHDPDLVLRGLARTLAP